MRLIRTSNVILKAGRRCMCSNKGADNPSLKNCKEQMPKQLNDYLKEDSPLKGLNVNNYIKPELLNSTNDILANLKPSIKDKIDPETTSIIMFPGQGNQFVGMGKVLLEHSVVEDMFDAASSILGYDLKKLCLHGPEKKLFKTEYCQPATLVCSLAALEELKFSYPSALSNCVATCGFSLGEIASLVFAGCLSFEKAVHLTRVRAKAMQECSEKVASGLMTVLYAADSRLKEAMEDAKQECISKGISNPVCEVANYLFPECKVIGGHDTALKYLENNLGKYKLRRAVRLPVSGAFHTSLMKDAVEPFAKALSKIEIKEPLVPVLSNCLGMPYCNVKEIKRFITKQLHKPVKWEQILHYVYERKRGTKFPHTYECGPGKSLSVILKRVNFSAYKNCHNILS